MRVAAGVEWAQDQPLLKVVVCNFGESSVDLQLRVWIEDARQRMNTISTITDRIKSAFDAENIEKFLITTGYSHHTNGQGLR